MIGENMDRLTKQIDFIREIDKLKQVFRRSLITDGSRYENDVEHSWHLAVMVTLLSEYAAESVDLMRTVKMVLIHDIVEIDAGDTIIYDTAGRKEVVQAEQAAADRIFGLLPDDQSSEFRAIWDEFEQRITPEARFARALDRLQPIMLNVATQGRTWRENKITFDRVMNLNRPIVEAGAPSLVPFLEQLLLDAREKGYFHSDE
jgi:putative hydrolases of HD superfamily